jgi:hypothetical protein
LKRLKQASVAELEAKQIPAGHDIIERIVDVQKGFYKVVWEKREGEKRRPPSCWIMKDAFHSFDSWTREISLLWKWKNSGLSKAVFMRQNPDARDLWETSKTMTADGVGWCAFRAVGIALELVFGFGVGRNPVNAEVITSFQQGGVQRAGRVKAGLQWVEVYSFMRQVCENREALDWNELKINRYKGNGVGLQAIRDMKLEDGLYLLGGYYQDRSVGHCVVLEEHSDCLFVHEEGSLGGAEALDWLHEISFVRRVKLRDETK